MINFSIFYSDLEFMFALLCNDMLLNDDIKYIADKLILNDADDSLIQILVSNETDNVHELFKKYLNSKGIVVQDAKRTLIKKIFYYILQEKLSLYEAMDFINDKIVLEVGSDKYVGDRLGIPGIIGDYDALYDMKYVYNSSVEEIQRGENILKSEMRDYINKN